MKSDWQDYFEIIKAMWIAISIFLMGIIPFVAIAMALYWWCK